MKLELQALSPAQLAAHKADALLLLLPDTAAPGLLGEAELGRWVDLALTSGDLEQGAGKLLAGYALPGVQARRVLLARCGDGSAAVVRKAVAGALASLTLPGVRRVVVHAGAWAADTLRAAMLAAAEASYRYTTTLSKGTPRALGQLVCSGPGVRALKDVLTRVEAELAGIELAKEWANRPANHATPSHLAEVARKLGKRARLSTQVLGPKEVEKLGMGAFLSVARGAREPLRFIVMRYEGGAKGAAPVVLVGKGVTFDTGGISLKPAGEMDEMKFDMCGAASVLGVFAALAELQPAINVVGLIPATENMPGSQATRPGDVVTSMSGQTIEILNTDAEGRLILCDALHYAERFKPRCVIDIATLTGACVIALGHLRSAVYSTRDELAEQLGRAGEAAQDPVWRMPLDAEYAEGLKSRFADVANVAGRPAGSVTAAKFLQRFVGDWPWAHLDIAGTAWKSGTAKGATGRPVGLLLQYLLDQAAADAQAGAPPRRPAARKAARRP